MAVTIRTGKKQSKGLRSLSRPKKRRAVRAEPEQHRQRPRDPEMSAAAVKRILTPLKEAAEAREELKEEYKEQVLAAQLAAMEASEANIPLRLIVEAGQFTRQYFYQIERDYKSGKLDASGRHTKLGAPKRKSLEEYEEEVPRKKSSKRKIRTR